MESEVIIELAEQLGLVANNVFEIFVKAQPILGVIDILLLFSMTVFVILIYKYTDRKTKGDCDAWDIKLTVVVCGIFLAAVIAHLLSYMFTRIFLPEYAAATELIKLLMP